MPPSDSHPLEKPKDQQLAALCATLSILLPAALAKLAQGKDPEAPLFPNYAKDRGADSCSAMLMKRLRSVITDKKLTMHSLRHRMKDKLRNTGCPEAISLAILGHSTNTVAANYGSGLCPGGHAGAYGEGLGEVMVKWTSGKSERTLNQSAANGRKEPTLTDAAICFNGCKVQIGIILRPNC